MSYNDRQWDNVMAFLNDEAEKPEPEGLGHPIQSAEELVQMLRSTEAIKGTIVRSGAGEARDLRRLERQKVIADQRAAELQDEIDNHPANQP